MISFRIATSFLSNRAGMSSSAKVLGSKGHSATLGKSLPLGKSPERQGRSPLGPEEVEEWFDVDGRLVKEAVMMRALFEGMACNSNQDTVPRVAGSEGVHCSTNAPLK